MFAAGSDAGFAPSGFERTVELGARSFDFQLRYGGGSPGNPSSSSSVLMGEGTVRTALPGQGQLTLRVPHIVSSTAAVGDTQLAASYELPSQALAARLAVTARVDLPTAPGSRGARPGVRATATKSLDFGVLDSLQVETELWTSGIELAPSYRASAGTFFRLAPTTQAHVGFVTQRPHPSSGAPRENLAQVGLSHRFDPSSSLRIDFATGRSSDKPTQRVTVGVERRF